MTERVQKPQEKWNTVHEWSSVSRILRVCENTPQVKQGNRREVHTSLGCIQPQGQPWRHFFWITKVSRNGQSVWSNLTPIYTLGRSTKAPSEDNSMLSRNRGSKNLALFPWSFLTDSQNSTHRTPFMNCVPLLLWLLHSFCHLFCNVFKKLKG